MSVLESRLSQALTLASWVGRLDSSPIPVHPIKQFNTTVSFICHIGPHETEVIRWFSSVWRPQYSFFGLHVGCRSRWPLILPQIGSLSISSLSGPSGWLRTCPWACCRSNSKPVSRSTYIKGICPSVLFFRVESGFALHDLSHRSKGALLVWRPYAASSNGE